jgi:hypothetical protein
MKSQWKDLDKYTFGEDKISTTIVNILNTNRDTALSEKVSRFLSGVVNKHLKVLGHKDIPRLTKKYLYVILKKHFIAGIELHITPLEKENKEKIETYIKNYTVMKLKKYLLR